MSRSQRQRGFTMIELMLAMVFVSFILVFISLSMVQMLRIYDKGVSMKQINQAGRSIIDDISRAVRSQLPSSIVTDFNAGVFCIDDTMYVWNPMYVGGTYLNGTFSAPTTYNSNQNAVEGNPVTGGTMARKKLSNPANGCSPTAPTTESSALLSSRARVLWAGVTSSDARLIKLTFIFGTYNRAEVVGAPANLITSPYTGMFSTPHLEGPAGSRHLSCLTGNAGNYCAFAEFSTVVYLSKEP